MPAGRRSHWPAGTRADGDDLVDACQLETLGDERGLLIGRDFIILRRTVDGALDHAHSEGFQRRLDDLDLAPITLSTRKYAHLLPLEDATVRENGQLQGVVGR